VTATTAFTAERSGVYRTPADVHGLRERAVAARLAWLEADLARVRGKAEVLAALAAAAELPAEFGHNWDALADSLGDFSWRPAAGYVLYLRNTAAARRALGAEWATLLEVLREVAREWKARGKVFVALVDDATLPAWP
jgi:ParB-like chromosome segregation protein Spo0J